MTPRMKHPLLTLAGVAVLCGLMPTLSLAQTPARAAVAAHQAVQLNFVETDLTAVARAVGAMVGQLVVVDPKVKGTLTLQTETPVLPREALAQFGQALRSRGAAIVIHKGVINVVSEADAKLYSGEVLGPDSKGKPLGVVTQIFTLDHENANLLVPVLRPLISPNNTVNVSPGANALVITDHADNLARLAQIIEQLDVAKPTEVAVVPLSHAVAADILPLLTRLVDDSLRSSGAPAGQAAAGQAPGVTLLSDARSNAIVIQAGSPARMALVQRLVAQLDVANPNATGGLMHVVTLKHANAVDMATTLRAALSAANSAAGVAGASNAAGSPTGTAAARTPGAANTSPAGGTAAPSVGGFIQADPATNALIVSAPEPVFRQLRAVIDQLDTRRAQVFVESLIVEVNADKASEFGIQWQGPLGRPGDGTVGLIGTNFGTGGNNLLNLAVSAATGAVAPGNGLNIALAPRVNGVYYLGALARFLEQNGQGNVLSTPNLLTLDNEEAKIVIGQNVPFVTGQFTNTNTGTGAVNPFQTIERKDVGLTLRVKPQVSDNGTVKLTLFQEVSNVVASSVNSAAGIITNKRSIESSVLVEDGGIVVLGGLLQDEYAGNEDKVPGVSNVPFFGNLFKSESRSRKKTNLMVFMRPVVIRTAEQTQALSQGRYDSMRGQQQNAQPTPNAVLGIDQAPQLPPVVDVPTPGGR